MTVVKVQPYTLTDLPGMRVAEVDDCTGEVVAVVRVDYQEPGRSLDEVARSYALLHGLVVTA